jgi:hypothetical protein
MWTLSSLLSLCFEFALKSLPNLPPFSDPKKSMLGQTLLPEFPGAPPRPVKRSCFYSCLLWPSSFWEKLRYSQWTRQDWTVYGARTFIILTSLLVCVFVPCVIHLQLCIMVTRVYAILLRSPIVCAFVSIFFVFPPFLMMIPTIHRLRRVWLVAAIFMLGSIGLSLSLLFFAEFTHLRPNTIRLHHIEQRWHTEIDPDFVTSSFSVIYAQSTDMANLKHTKFPYDKCVFFEEDGTIRCSVTLTDPADLLVPKVQPNLRFTSPIDASTSSQLTYGAIYVPGSNAFALDLSHVGVSAARWYGPCVNSTCTEL